MPSVTQSIVIPASKEACFDFVSDPEKATIFINSLHSIVPVSHNAEGICDSWTWEYNLLGIPLRGKSSLVKHEKPNTYVWKSTDGAESTWTYTFEDVDGGTKVSVTIEYTTPEQLLAKFNQAVVDAVGQREAKSGLENLQTVLSNS